MNTATLERINTGQQIIANSAVGHYKRDFQPVYSDQVLLEETLNDMISMATVTTPDQVDRVRRAVANSFKAPWGQPVIITNECSESVDLKTDVSTLAARVILQRELVFSVYPDALHVSRDRGQVFKPRSSEYEELPSGLLVLSYQGDGTNSREPFNREPDPRRLMAAALQARGLEEFMTNQLGEHVPAAHEALHLAYEKCFIVTYRGKKYLLSADMPWAGLRTNDPDGPHVRMLEGIENAVGAKIGANSNKDHIKALAARLNPKGIPGKLIFMLRLGEDVDAMDEVLEGIRKHAPSSTVMYDIHGSTRTVRDMPDIHGGTTAPPNSLKVRSVESTVRDIELLAAACLRHGQRLRGLHLETHADDNRQECVDHDGQRPRDKSIVDPGFNPGQTLKILQGVAHILR